ncbi:MAG: DUF4336 domain-containing protein [Alphaproteobacteria bacterium]|nr:DUF4336 domain-containing protein [Alphaproteobacteria bacterium]
MSAELDAIATPREDNHVAGMPGFGMLLAQASASAAWRTLVHGSPSGRRALSVPADGGFRLMGGPLRLALAVVVVGGILAAAVEAELAWRLGIFLLALGLLLLGVLVVVAAVVEATVPPPRRPMPPRDDDPFSRHDEATGLVAVAPGVWVAQVPLVFHGLRLGARMTVLDTGAGLVVCSPVPADPALVDAVQALGPVRWIVAPNPLHHLFVDAWHAAVPEAELWAAPGLAERRPDLPWTGTLERAEDAPWDRPVVDVVVFRGGRMMVEVGLMHHPSGTLVLADLVQNLGQDPARFSWVQRFGLAVLGMAQRPSPPPEYKLTVDDPATLRRAIDGVLAWEVERIVIAHGPVVHAQAEVVLADAFAFVR